MLMTVRKIQTIYNAHMYQPYPPEAGKYDSQVERNLRSKKKYFLETCPFCAVLPGRYISNKN